MRHTIPDYLYRMWWLFALIAGAGVVSILAASRDGSKELLVFFALAYTVLPTLLFLVITWVVCHELEAEA